MTDHNNMTQAQLEQIGIEALAKSLGSAGMLRFMQQFDLGSGDYTRDRDKILGNPTLEEIVAEIKELRQAQVESSETLPKYTNVKMIDVSQLTQSQIRQMGIEALTQTLGSVGMMRFMEQIDLGSGDYTQNTEQILSNIINEEITASIEKQRQQ